MDVDSIFFNTVLTQSSQFELARRYDPDEIPRSIPWDLLHKWAAAKSVQREMLDDIGHSDSYGLYQPMTDPYEIRVLELHPGTGQDPLHGSLRHCSVEFQAPFEDLFEGPSKAQSRTATQHALAMDDLCEPVWYTALSYTWGAPVFSDVLRCDGHDKPITASLHAALCRLRQPDHAVHVWVDQICINQDDDAEKACQIRLMGRIYKHALSTAVWLGPASDTSAHGLALLADLAVRLQFDTPLASPADFVGLNLPPADAPAWPGLWEVLTRPWFRRLWVIQELFLSRDVWVVCGPDHEAWDYVSTACTHLQGQGIVEWLRLFAGNDDDDDDDATDTITTINELGLNGSMNSILGDGDVSQEPVWALLVATRHARCYDPRDKVYGVLSLCRPAEAAKVDVSYGPDCTPKTLYRAVAVDTLHAQAYPLDTVLACVDHAPSPGLPSWVADWRRPRQTASLGYSTWAQSLYDAAGIGLSKDSPVYTVDGDLLRVQGTVHDTLDFFTGRFVRPDLTYADPAAGNGVLHASVALIDQALQSGYFLGDGVFEALWRSLVANRNETGQLKAPDTFAEIFSLLLDASTGRSPTLPGQTYSPRQQRPLGRGRLELSSLAVRGPGRTFQEARTALQAAAKNRCLGITKKGHIGLFPGWCQQGDCVCIFRGCHVPFLLRPEPDSANLRLLGECYVHGIMDGEAKTAWETLTIA